MLWNLWLLIFWEKDRVKVYGVYSLLWRAISASVPQGAHRDPCSPRGLTMVINFCVNDLNYFVCNTTLKLYGDDTTEYASDTSPVVLQLILACYQAGLNLIQ